MLSLSCSSSSSIVVCIWDMDHQSRAFEVLEYLPNCCVWTIHGVTRHQQWREHILSRQLAAVFRMEEPMANILMYNQLCWLGHSGCMEPVHMPKQLQFGKLEKRRPCHGTKKRGWDVVTSDLQTVVVKDAWYEVAQYREVWYQVSSMHVYLIIRACMQLT